jgi:hypothetical protein
MRMLRKSWEDPSSLAIRYAISILPSRFSDLRITVRITERIPGETGRLRKVIEMVVDKSDRAKNMSAKGHGFGFAAQRRFRDVCGHGRRSGGE